MNGRLVVCIAAACLDSCMVEVNLNLVSLRDLASSYSMNALTLAS